MEIHTSAGADRCHAYTLHPEQIAVVEPFLLSDDHYASLAETFKALADPSRAKILHALLHTELCVCDLAALAGLSVSATSQHLRVLRNLRVVKRRRGGKEMLYSLEDAHIRTLLTVSLQHLTDDVERGTARASSLPAAAAAVHTTSEQEVSQSHDRTEYSTHSN